MKIINFVDSEEVKVSEEGGRVSSEGSFTDCTHYAFLDKTWSWRLGTMRDQGIIKFWLKGRSNNEKSIFHQTFKISLLQIWLIWGFQERRIFVPRILRRVLDTGSCHQKVFIYLSELFSYLLRSKTDEFIFIWINRQFVGFHSLAKFNLFKIHTVEPRYNDPRYNNVPGISINNVPTKVTIKCMWENPDVTIFDITLFPISRWEFSGPNVK